MEGLSNRYNNSISDRFNDREVSKIKKMVLEQEKKERKDNIVIKGLKVEQKVEK